MSGPGIDVLAPYLAACLLLAGAGAAKALRPGDTARAMVGLLPPGDAGRLAGVTLLVRLGAVAETTLGVLAAIFPSRPLAILVAASYGTFAAVVVVARRRGGALASCGCFGTPDTPATGLHAVLDAGLAVAASLVAATAGSPRVGGSALWAVMSAEKVPLGGVPLLALAAATAWLCYLLMAPLARLMTTRRRPA